MDPITIAGLVAMLAGSAIQYKAGSDAQERQRAQVARSIDAQRALQLQAENKALDAAGKYAAPERAAEQSTIADQIAQDLIAPVSESQAIRANQQTTQGAVSGDYKNAKVVSDLNTVKAAEQLARMMGKTASSGRLRMNEGIRLMDTGQQIGTLQNFSSGRGRNRLKGRDARSWRRRRSSGGRGWKRYRAKRRDFRHDWNEWSSFRVRRSACRRSGVARSHFLPRRSQQMARHGRDAFRRRKFALVPRYDVFARSPSRANDGH